VYPKHLFGFGDLIMSFAGPVRGIIHVTLTAEHRLIRIRAQKKSARWQRLAGGAMRNR
jgi:hypothetical protein